MQYFMNGKKINSAEAKMVALKGYYAKGYACPEDFNLTWDCRFDSEESRDMIFDWSGYSLEIFTEEQAEYLED